VSEWKVILRRADLADVAFVHRFVHCLGSAACTGILEHADQISMTLRRVVAQRVLARDAAGQVHVDVRARRERGQWRAIDADQFDRADVDRFDRLACHPVR